MKEHQSVSRAIGNKIQNSIQVEYLNNTFSPLRFQYQINKYSFP